MHESLEYINSGEIVGALRPELIAAFESAEQRLKEKRADLKHNRIAIANLKQKVQLLKQA